MKTATNRPLSPRLEQAHQLWEACFEDDRAFVDFYFTHVARQEETELYHLPDGRAVAHIGTPRYTLGVNPSECISPLEAIYISGACVLPEYRRAGIMQRMMIKIMQEAQGADVVALIPASEALRDYYTRTFGFVTIGERSYIPWEAVPVADEVGPAKTLAQLLVQSLSTRLGIRLDLAQGENVVNEYRQFARVLDRRERSGLFQALALVRPTPEAMYIDHIVGGEADRLSMIEELKVEAADRPILVRTAEPTHGARPWGMIRPLNILRILSVWLEQHPTEAIAFSYSDPIVPALSGYYQTKGRQLTFTPDDIEREPRLSLEDIVTRFLPRLDLSLVHE